MKSKILILLVFLLAISSVYAGTVELTAEVDIDWTSRYTVEIEVEGGQSTTINCSQVTQDNYQDFDVDLEARVKYEGKRYESDVDIDWQDETEFAIETESEDVYIDCADIDTNYNDFDDNFEFTFEIHTEGSSTEEVEDIVKRYLNFTGEIGICTADLAACDVEKTSNYDKWLGCEEEGGAYKNEVSNQKQDITYLEGEVDTLEEQVSDKEVKIANLEGQVTTCQNQRNSMADRIEEAEDDVEEAKKKASSNLIVGALIAGAIVYFVNRKDSDKPPEEVELYPG